MNLIHLKYAVEIAKTKSISRAAENLYMGQPNLSRAVKELEDSLNITIFQRNSKGITITPEGEEFLHYARRILNQVEEVEAIYKESQNRKQRFGSNRQLTEGDFSGSSRNLIQAVKGSYFLEKGRHVFFVDFLFAPDRLVDILDQLAGSIAQGSGTVENGCYKGIFGILQKQTGGVDLNIIIQIMILTPAAEVILILRTFLCF